MKCKFCNEELPEKGYFCPVCGGDQREFELEEELTEEVLEEEELVFEQEAEEAAPVSQELKKAKRIAAFTGCVAGLAILALVLFLGIRGGWDVKSWFDWQIFRENTVSYKDSYTVDDKKAGNKSDVVVATLGDAQLTNGQLQIYYWSEVYNFVSNYYSYLSYLGLDYTAPLDQQMYSEDMTWQQYFISAALNTWQANQSLCDMAKANNYEMPAETRTELDNMVAQMEADALKNGYESAEAMVHESFGAGCTVADYVTYMEVYYYAYSYFADLYEQINPTDAEVEAYFVANEQTLKENGITKDMGNIVNVRHILATIDSYASEESIANKNYTEEEWAACYAAAEEILNQWLTNPTEEYFAELANAHSEDGGSNKNGGLYTDITKSTNYVEPFLNWCMDANRQLGDYEIVQTSYGYHIMYFSATDALWFRNTRDTMIGEEAQKIVNEALEAATPEINYKKLVLGNITF